MKLQPRPMINVAALMKLLKQNRMKHFRAHIPILIEKKNFIVKTADSKRGVADSAEAAPRCVSQRIAA
ncbi:MAG: hypothetical protein LRZ88_11065 [Candidatus Cloacimonetes bacterium]|nr:hypothetical protein [Candidatus Cloacimonadota bacterium]